MSSQAASETGGEWLTIEEAASYLGLASTTLRRRLEAGVLPATRRGRTLYLLLADLDAHIEKCRLEPGELDHLRVNPLRPPGRQ